MVKQLLRVSVWLPHHLDPEVIFKKMWTARSLCSAQVLLLQLKEGRLCSCMFPKTQQFWMGILKYCTVRAPRNRAKFQKCKQFAYGFAEEVRKLDFGAVTPGYDFMKTLREGIESVLPSDAHEIAENRLYVSVTNTKNGENRLVSSFASREDLIKVLLASSFVPVYAGIKPVEYKGEKWVDGGLTNGLPILPVGRTVTISPFSGRLDICPQDKGRVDLYVKFAKQDIMLSLANLVRLNQALFPPNQEKMESLYQNGFDDAVQFLLKENWFE
ncbi:patatin-like phospholipase domain-containing protein 4 isoform X5 [Opisthocomus hoazin]|uniref:patatin-like phospholipase domain-containing protein 4 isoform X5 n=1 Tax=Opisthocomus hoazin TaxID=30419 RepID=UPI003F53C482